MGDWLEVDGVSDPGDDGLTLGADGLRQRRDGRLTVVPWDHVLGVERVAWRELEILYVMTARRPPRPPWIEVRAADLPDAFTDLSALECAIEGRVAQGGFRSGARPRARMSLDDLRDAVMARGDVDGMVEVPVGIGPAGRDDRFRLTPLTLLWAPPLVTVFLAVTGAFFLAGWFGPAMVHEPRMAIGLAVVLLIFSYLVVGVAYVLQLRRRRRRAGPSPGRVLVLAPDGFVIGTTRGVMTFRWSDAELGPRRRENGGWELAVAGPDGSIAGAVEAEWLDAPLPLIVAVAKAYRERFGIG